MIILGVTGSIGSGKSYFCKCLKRLPGVMVLSSDEEVHKIYAGNKKLVKEIEAAFPSAVNKGVIDRKILGEIVFKDPSQKKVLENIVYPILRANRQKFIQAGIKRKAKLLVLEIPLLFENGLDSECDVVVTVYCSPIIQKLRVLRRKTMTEEKFNNIIATQMPVSEKIKFSDFHINTGRSKAATSKLATKLYLTLTGQIEN